MGVSDLLNSRIPVVVVVVVVVNVVSSDIRVMQIFATVREIWGVKQESGHLTCQCCRAFTLALARLSCFTGRMPFLPPSQQRQSTEGKSELVSCIPKNDMVVLAADMNGHAC